MKEVYLICVINTLGDMVSQDVALNPADAKDLMYTKAMDMVNMWRKGSDFWPQLMINHGNGAMHEMRMKVLTFTVKCLIVKPYEREEESCS